MSYQIFYETRKHPWDRRRKLKIGVVATICACILLLAAGGLCVYNDFMYPDDANITAAALESMAQSIKVGTPLKDAIVAFCQEVLDHANIST